MFWSLRAEPPDNLDSWSRPRSRAPTCHSADGSPCWWVGPAPAARPVLLSEPRRTHTGSLSGQQGSCGWQLGAWSLTSSSPCFLERPSRQPSSSRCRRARLRTRQQVISRWAHISLPLLGCCLALPKARDLLALGWLPGPPAIPGSAQQGSTQEAPEKLKKGHVSEGLVRRSAAEALGVPRRAGEAAFCSEPATLQS